MYLRLLLLLSLALSTASAIEPLTEDKGAAGLAQSLRRLSNPYRVLHIVAHPDDEDGGTLTYLSRGLGADVTIASITRGESGANLVTGDFFDALGVLRTLEYRKAAQHYGARLRFTRFADFGFSKSREETFRNWDRGEVLRDLVRIIREEKPHIILARWQGSPRDGHGQHQAAGEIAQEAYEAAADPARFPDDGPAPWQALKLYSDNRREEDDWTIAIDSGVYDPLLGQTYAQMARLGLRYQRSQGAGGAIAEPGPSVRHYKLLASQVGMPDREQSLFERLGVKVPERYAGAVKKARESFEAERPERCVPALVEALAAVRQGSGEEDGLTVERREALLQQAISQALGVSFELLVEPAERPAGPFSSFQPYETISVAAPGRTFEVRTQFAAGSAGIAASVRLEAPPGWKVRDLGDGRHGVTVPADARASAVHWGRASVWDVSYEIRDAAAWGRALPPAPLTALAAYVVEKQPIYVQAAAEASFVDSSGIQRRRDLAVGPAVSVEFPTDAGAMPIGAAGYRVAVRLKNNFAGEISGDLKLSLPDGWSAEPAAAPFAFQKEGERREVEFRMKPPAGVRPGSYEIQAEAAYEGGRSRDGFQAISYPGLETAYLSRPAVHRVQAVDVQAAPGLKIGYVMGPGDDVPEGLRQLGAEVTLLDSDALASGDLSRFDTILLGIRAYAVREDLKAHNARLLQYVEQGGALVVQYNTPEYDANYGPYPYVMGRRPEEVAEEDSPVRILTPEHPVFNWPNRITTADFDGWVEQRGSKFLAEWDPRYEALVETHDSDQEPQSGGWLVAPYGKGLYVYCAYAWYRQLPYGVPGAVRIFANLMSLGSPDAPWRR